MSVNRAVAIAAATDETGLRSSYERAVSHGAANTLCTPEEESAHGTLRLLTLATLRLPDLYLYGYLLEAVDEDPWSSRCPGSPPRALGRSRPARCGSRTARWRPTPTSSATTRACWVERALEHARAQLSGDLERAQRPLVELGATVRDRAHTRDRCQRRRGNARTRRARRRIGESARALPDRDHAGMSARPRSALDRVPVWARRGVMIALPLVSVWGAGRRVSPRPHPSHPPRQPNRASTSIAGPTLPPARPDPVSTEATASARPGRPRRFLGTGARGGLGDPERPPSPRSPAGAMLAVAARFAAAYMPYQIGRLPGWARAAAMERTCTPAFAHYLLSRPAEQSPLQSAHPTCRRDLPRRERQPRRWLEPSLRELRLTAGSGRHRRVPADARPAPRPLARRWPGDVNHGAKAVAVRARAHDPAAAAGGHARRERRQRIAGAVRRSRPCEWWAGRRRPGDGHSHLPGSGRTEFALGDRGPSILAAINYIESTFFTSTLPGVHSAPTAREPQGRCRSASTDKPATPGTRSKSTPRAIRPGSRRTSTTRPTLSTAPPTTCRHPARLVTGPPRSSTTTTQAPTSSRSCLWPPATTPRALPAKAPLPPRQP